MRSMPAIGMARSIVLSMLLCGTALAAPTLLEATEPSWKELDTHSFAEAKQLKALLQKSDTENDLARAKLTIDQLIDPSIDVEANLKKIDAMVAAIQSQLPNNASDSQKLNGIRQYLYKAGPWNGNQSYSYDLDDPLGTKIANKLLPHYLDTRKGNCVSMPFLLIILGQRLGLDITASTAPLHVFVKYTDRQTHQTINLEATSGGTVARDAWIRQQIPMTDTAIQNGLYMQKLTKNETIAVMALSLAESYSANRQYKKAVLISDLILEHYPKNADSMVRKAFCFSRLIQTEFVSKYPSADDIPEDQRGYLEYLADNRQQGYDQATALGWRAPDDQQDTQYLKRVQNAKAKIN